MERIHCPHCGSSLVEVEPAEGLVTLRSPEGSELVAHAQGIFALHCGQAASPVLSGKHRGERTVERGQSNGKQAAKWGERREPSRS